jgi:hypothetical protein
LINQEGSNGHNLCSGDQDDRVDSIVSYSLQVPVASAIPSISMPFMKGVMARIAETV